MHTVRALPYLLLGMGTFVFSQLTPDLLIEAEALCGSANISLVSICNLTAFAYPSGEDYI